MEFRVFRDSSGTSVNSEVADLAGRRSQQTRHVCGAIHPVVAVAVHEPVSGLT